MHALDALVELGVVDGEGGEAADGDDRRRLLRRVAPLRLAVCELEHADDAFPRDERHDEGAVLAELLHEPDLDRREVGVVAALDDDRLA